MIDPEIVLKNIATLEPILIKKESVTASAIKVMEIVAKLPSQNVDTYLVDLVHTISEVSESESPLQQLTKLACKK